MFYTEDRIADPLYISSHLFFVLPFARAPTTSTFLFFILFAYELGIYFFFNVTRHTSPHIYPPLGSSSLSFVFSPFARDVYISRFVSLYFCRHCSIYGFGLNSFLIRFPYFITSNRRTALFLYIRFVYFFRLDAPLSL